MSGPLDAIAVAAVRTVLPLARALTDGWALRTMLREMGWAIDLSEVDDALLGAIPGGPEIAAAVEDAVGLAQQLVDGTAEAGDVAGAAIALVHDVMPAIDDLAGFDPGGVVSDATSALADPSFWAELALDLPEYLLLRYLRDYQPVLRSVLRLLGVIVDDRRQSPFLVGAEPAETTRERLVWDHVTALVSDPSAHLRDHYDWSPGQEIAHESLVTDGAALLSALGLSARTEPVGTEFGPESPTGFYPPGHPDAATARQLGLTVFHAADATSGAISDAAIVAVPVPTTPANDHPVDGFVITAVTSGSLAAPVPLGDTWTLTARSGFAESGATGLLLSPGSAEAHEPGPTTESGLTLATDLDGPLTLLGGTSGPRLLLHGAELTCDVRVGPPAELVIGARSAGDPGMELVVDAGDGDGFVAALLAAVELSVPLELGLTWSSTTGFAVDAATGLIVDVPINRDIGPVHLATLHLLFVVGTDGASFTAGIDATAALGPFVVTVGNIGLVFELAPPDGGGTLQAALAFKPPDGLGLALDAGIVSGGGYLDIDVEAGSYEGVVDLQIAAVGISAVVIVDTKAPGVSGWSVFLALFLDLPSIQLGFGFTLEGVGGIAGINRTVDEDALMAAVHAGSLDTVLFPTNPIADAPEIIDTFSAIFTPAEGRYVFGPVVQIGWGTPALITAELGVVIELPDPILIAVLGSITSILPTEDLDLVELHIDFSAVVDFEAGTLDLFASLHDSSVVGFSLAGDMALQAAFTEQPSFVLAMGGFHPGFDVPCGFPELAPLSLGINAGEIIDISFECYFAVTTNTVQFGAAIEVEAKIEGFGVEGGMSFDTLVQFQPFWFTTSVDMHVSVTAGDFDLLAVRLYGSLEGPNPWRVIGTAEFEFLGFAKRIHVDEQIGGKRADPSVEAPDVLDELCRIVESDDAWAAGVQPASTVTLAAPTVDPTATSIRLAPDQTLVVTQRLVPLDTTIERFGESTGLEHERFTLTVSGATAGPPATLTDWFAVGHFEDLAPQEQLVTPSFEQFPAGLEFGGGVTGGPARPIEQGHEQFIRDPLLPDLPVGLAKSVVMMSDHQAAAQLSTATAATWVATEVSFAAVGA